MSGQQQHVDLFRKTLLRQALLAKATGGAVYVPFIGDGDIAVELYADRDLYGADTDIERVRTAQGRLPSGHIKQADCDNYPFPEVTEPFAVADFDSYSYPYSAFRTFWGKAKKTDPMVMFFTDGQRQSVSRTASFIDPSGNKQTFNDSPTRRKAYNFYWQQNILPWFTDYIKPWNVLATKFYLRGQGMLYWGAIVSQKEAAAIEEGMDEDGPIKRGAYKFNPARRKKYLELVAGGARLMAAAELVDVSRQTVWAALKNDPEFAAAVELAELAACEPVETALLEAATSGNVPAIQTWLYNRSRGRWKPPNVKTEISGPDGGPIEHKNVDLTDEERADRIAALLDTARARRARQFTSEG